MTRKIVRPSTFFVYSPLCYLDTHLKGVRLGRTGHRKAVVAYADDIMIFVLQREDFRVARDAIQHYEKASGSRLNIQKSKALAVGGWTGTKSELGVDFVSNVRILGITFSNTIDGAPHNRWSRTASKVKRQVQKAYARNLCLVQRIRYVHSTLLAPTWYVAQILPPPETCTRELKTAISRYLGRGETFRVPLTTLQKPKTQGEWTIRDVTLKCQALLLRRVWLQSQKEGTATAEWLRAWRLVGHQHNPPHVGRIPVQLAYLRQYARDTAYIAPPTRTEASRNFKRRMYDTLFLMATAGKIPPVMRIVQKRPNIHWDLVWRNLRASCVPEEVRSA